MMWWFWVNKDMSWTEEIPPWNRITVPSAQNVSQLILNTHKPVQLVWNEGWGVEERAASDSAIFYCLQIQVTCPVMEEPHLKGTERSPDPAKRASANPSPADQASGRL